MTETTPTKPASAQGAVETLRKHVTALGAGCCTCGIKSSDVQWHAEYCKVWNVAHALDVLDDLAAAPAPAASPPSMVRIKSALDHLWSEALRRQKEGGMIDPCWLETVIQPARASLASDATANSRAGDEDVRGSSWADFARQQAKRRIEAEAALVKAVAEERKACARVRPEKPETFHYQADGYASGWHAAISAFRAAIRARTLATPETESRDD